MVDPDPNADETPDADETGGPDKPAAGNDTAPISPYVVKAVQLSQSNVVDVAQQEGASIAFQKVAQAAAFAVQDATDYLRNVQTISTAAQGVALTLMLETKNPFYATVLAAAQEAVVAAQTNFAAVGDAASTTASAFATAIDGD